jgi:hypothetical protein
MENVVSNSTYWSKNKEILVLVLALPLICSVKCTKFYSKLSNFFNYMCIQYLSSVVVEVVAVAIEMT